MRVGGKLVITTPDGTVHETKGSFSYSIGGEQIKPFGIGDLGVSGTITGTLKWTGPLRLYPYSGKKRIREKYRKRFCKIFGMPYMYPNKRNARTMQKYLEWLMPSNPLGGDDLRRVADMYGVSYVDNEHDESIRMKVLNIIRSPT